uniref:Uncharacterized protein n=1 Tax=Tanacetum cinerariifolium TaxID=118510 RepID=A0A699GMZ5_TANCI|nr:hypothetical protein [Tanacetum cinerariifolium]
MSIVAASKGPGHGKTEHVIHKVGDSNALSKPVTSNSVPSSRESTVVNNERVIAPGIFRINPFEASRIDNFMPNKHVKASVKKKPINVSQPHVITKKELNSNTNSFSLKDIESTTKTRRSQSRNNPKNDKNKKSNVIYATCKQCLITANDECVLLYVNGMKSRKKNKSDNVLKSENQKKHKANVKKLKKLGSKESLSLPRPIKPRTCLRWLSTGRTLNPLWKNNCIQYHQSESDTSVCDNANASNP